MVTATGLLEEFDQIAREVGLSYLVIGGFAASFWGTPRFTADIDFVVAKNDLETVKAIAARLQYDLEFLHPRGSFAHFAPLGHEGLRLDFMLVDEHTWTKLESESVVGDIGGANAYPIVGAMHLIAMKLHASKQPDRDEYLKDISDIVETMRAQGITFEDLEKNGTLSKHGSPRTNELLKTVIKSRSGPSRE